MNRLAKETSPYLLQHAHNPVDWYPWGEEAFAKARKEDKSILVSIGYSTCHWCHVMERESFEKDDVAAVMNEHFVCIKVDREERPDVDAIYMEAIQAMTGSGGWPLNCFLTTDGRPFYGGTYFPPTNAFNRPSWMNVLNGIAGAWEDRRDEIFEQATKLTGHLVQGSNNFLKKLSADQEIPAPEKLYQHLQDRFDRIDGGFGGAPKFPGTMSLEFLLRYHYYTGNKEALGQVMLSLDKMIAGGIYDQLGGGFARYATDHAWMVPHFEKMLYDNALLIKILSETYLVTGKEHYRQTIEHTLSWVLREMLHPEGCFYAAMDADSEGVEGKFYVWSKAEIDQLLGNDSIWFCDNFGVTEEGNWEHTNILYRKDVEVKVPNHIEQVLMAYRNKRVWPGTDDKIMLDWNALMISAFAVAGRSLGQTYYTAIAVKAMDFIWDNFRTDKESLEFYHTWKNGEAKFPGYLDDYAYLTEALLELYTSTMDAGYLDKAGMLMEYINTHFYDEQDGFYYLTREAYSKDLVFRRKDTYDNATPSGNSSVANLLIKLSVLLHKPEYRSRAEQMLRKIGPAVEQFPNAFGRWASLLLSVSYKQREIAVVGENFDEILNQLNQRFLPDSLIMASTEANDQYPLLEKRGETGETLIYICENYACQKPVKSLTEANIY